MSTRSERIVGADGSVSGRRWPLHGTAATRPLEVQAPGASPLMPIAGLALARLALALAPHARTIWIACGPGNNGGDGLVAASHLHAWGKRVVVTGLHDPATAPADAQNAWQQWQRQRGQPEPLGADAPLSFDLCIDALFGIGRLRPMTPGYAGWIAQMHVAGQPVLSVDVPSGLDADTGQAIPGHVRATHTLSLLTLKPGLFTAQGRDAAGEIWFNNLGVSAPDTASAYLMAPPPAGLRPHASHKGSFGDVAVVGGAPGMLGAALLAARSALHAGAGRVYVNLLDSTAPRIDPVQPELMFRDLRGMDWRTCSVVAGCGGGEAIAPFLPDVLAGAKRLVLDADALNQLALHPSWEALLHQRPADSTAMTPHPLEAARLLGLTVGQVQADRLQAAQALAERYRSVVVLKGSGTVVASPAAPAHLNPTGDARLASGGTGDVLAGLLGALLAQGLGAAQASCEAVYRHGRAAQGWRSAVLPAASLYTRL